MTRYTLDDLLKPASEEDFYNAVVELTQRDDLTNEQRLGLITNVITALLDKGRSQGFLEALYTLVVNLIRGNVSWFLASSQIDLNSDKQVELWIAITCSAFLNRKDDYATAVTIYTDTSNKHKEDQSIPVDYSFPLNLLMVKALAEYYTLEQYRAQIHQALVSGSNYDQILDLSKYLATDLLNADNFAENDYEGTVLLLADLGEIPQVEVVLHKFHEKVVMASLGSTIFEDRPDYYAVLEGSFRYAAETLAQRYNLAGAIDAIGMKSQFELMTSLIDLTGSQVPRNVLTAIFRVLPMILSGKHSENDQYIKDEIVQCLINCLIRLAIGDEKNPVDPQVVEKASEQIALMLEQCDLEDEEGHTIFQLAMTSLHWEESGQNTGIAKMILAFINKITKQDPPFENGHQVMEAMVGKVIGDRDINDVMRQLQEQMNELLDEEDDGEIR